MSCCGRGVLSISCGLLALALGFLDTPRVQDPEPRPFSHAGHVALAWLEPDETARDCRGCHGYSTDPAEGHDPQAVCNACHMTDTTTFRVQTTEGYRATLDPLRQLPSAFFEHTDHGNLACSECHRPNQPLGSFDPMPIQRGIEECARCHGLDVQPEFAPGRGQAIDRSKLREGFLTALNNSPLMGPDELGPFLHEEHLRDPSMSVTLEQLRNPNPAVGTCAYCHAGVLTATAQNLGGQQVAYSSCSTCHQDSTVPPNPLPFRPGNLVVPSGAALTFAHADHLEFTGRGQGISDPAGYQRIASGGCSACHGSDSAKPTSEDWDLHVAGTELDAFAYAGCVTCHSSPQWQTSDHGEWMSCQSCHVIGTGEMKANRPTASVQRFGPAPFRIETHTHPFITTAEGELSPDCRECHRAPVRELPSRLQERAFNHTTHLPQQPAQQDCDSCHAPRVNSSALSRTLGFAAESGETLLSYNPQTCNQCHKGGQVRSAQPTTRPETRSVVEFSHQQHLGKTTADRRQITCLVCHEPRAGVPLGVIPAAMDCTLCHDHTETGSLWENTGGIRGTDVTSCALCHVSGVPEIQAELALAQTSLAGLTGSQLHPADRECSACHLQGDPPPYLVGEDHVFAVGGFLPRSSRTDRHPAGQEWPQNCLGCHWYREPTGAPNGNDSEDPAIRRRLGNVLEGFPGERARR